MGKNSCGDDHLPLLPDVYFMIQEILVCLPVKSLFRFKSVCKSWRQLIQSSFFIDLHTTTTFNSSSSKFGDTNFILQTTEYEYSPEKYGDDIKLYMLSSSSESGSNGDHGDNEDNEDDEHQKKKKMVFKLDDLGFLPFYRDFLLEDTLRMVGSCNGIICLHDPNVMDYNRGCPRQHYSNLRDVCLWNPATRQFRILPKSIPIQEKQEYIEWLEDFIGFGFDVNTKDYKVLRITPLREKSEEEEGGYTCRVQVYSLSTDSWRLLEGINSLPCLLLPCLPNQSRSRNHGIYLNGSYFFLGNKSNNGVWGYMLMSFDFTKEIVTTMQLPEDNRYSYGLSYLGEKLVVFTIDLKLVVFTFQINCDSYDYYDIWVLNEQHGSGHDVVNNESSWTKLHSFRIKSSREPTDIEPSDSPDTDDDDDDTYTELSHTKPRCISNNGEFALISTEITNEDGYPKNKFVLFNLITKEAIKDFTIDIIRAEVYKESLVSIMGGGNDVLLRWQLPSHGTTYKLNLDAPFIYSGCTFGIGLCLTSDTGGCIGVRSLQAFYVRDATQGEALAMLEAIKWAKKLELSPIIIESDSKNVVSFFMDDDDDDDDNNSTYWSSEALSLLGEAKLLLNSSSELDISFQYCSRSRNYVADIAAKLGREGPVWHCKEWTANSPGEIVMSLSKDLGLETNNYWAFDSGLETENYLASESCLETENYWTSYSGLKTEKGWASDSGLETEKGWANDSGLETDKGWASE